MSITKNPFEKSFRGGSEKKGPEPKPDVTTTPSKKAAATPDPATAAPAKPVTHGGGLPPTRKGSDKGDEAPAPAPAGFQKANPFHTPKHPQVSNVGPRPEGPASWNPAKLPEDPNAKPKPVVATTAQGQEIIVPTAAPEDYEKRVEESSKTLGDVAKQEMTGANYQDVYKAQQELEARQKEAERQQLLNNTLTEQRKRMEQGAINAEKARGLMAKIASLQLRLIPNMDANEAYRIHGEIEQVRVELAQIQFYG